MAGAESAAGDALTCWPLTSEGIVSDSRQTATEMALGRLAYRLASRESGQLTLPHELRFSFGVAIAFNSPEETVNQQSVISAELLFLLSVIFFAMLSKAALRFMSNLI